MSSVQIQTAAGNSLSCVSITAFGKNIRDIRDICNIPTFVPKNVFGKETYITVLEPVEEVKEGEELITFPDIKFNTVGDLVESFFNYVIAFEDSTESVVEISFCGYKYLYRPKHKTHYGSYAREYLIQPLIARYIFGKMPGFKLECDPNDVLPYKYDGYGTGKGVFYYDMKIDNTSAPVKAESKTDTTFNAPDGFYTHMNSISGFNKAFTVAKIGKQAIDEITDFVSHIKQEAKINLVFNSTRTLDICRAKEFEGYCLLGYKTNQESTKNVKVLKVPEHPNVCLLFVQKETEDEALEILKTEISDEIEVV